MYAIIQAGGNQYKVTIGQTIEVDLVAEKVNSLVKYPSILVVDGDKVLLGNDAAKIQVTAKILAHAQGEKIDIQRFRHKVRHRRHVGFRPQITKLLIEDIAGYKKPIVSKTAVKSTKIVKKITRPRK